MKYGDYPLTLVLDRYSGAYSGGVWLAFHSCPHSVPEEIGGDDVDEQNFYYDPDHPEKQELIGRGKDPQSAIDDLRRRYKEKWG